MSIILILLPFLGAIIITINPTKKIWKIKNISLIISIVTFLVSIIIWSEFNFNNNNYQFTIHVENISQLSFGIDYLSFWFIILTTFTIPIVILASNKININIKSIKQYISLIIIFQGFIHIVFISIDLIIFYISFEAVLIPLCLLVGIYGGTKRIQAAYILFLYTLIGSLPILLSIINIYNITGTSHIWILSFIIPKYAYFTWFAIFIGLAIKSPVVPVHLWLKTAHSEANVATSIILAGIVLKIATYGYIRLLIQIIPIETSYFQNLIAIICFISVIYTAFTSIRQTDFKQLIAYSSINHIGIVNLAIFSNTLIGIQGGIILSLAHGIVSPALFYLVGGIIYDRYHSRTIRYFRGLSIYIPIFSIFFFIFIIANCGTPGTANWIGEFLSLSGSYIIYPIITIIASITIVLSACYSIYLFNRICFGSWSIYLKPVQDINRIEFNVIIPLFIITFIIGFFPNFILSSLHNTSFLIY